MHTNQMSPTEQIIAKRTRLVAAPAAIHRSASHPPARQISVASP
jgi:hypothetical protein